MDLNGDGLVDYIQSSFYGNRSAMCLINNGENMQDGTGKCTAFQMTLGDTQDNGVRIMDLNADGLPDMISASKGSSTLNPLYVVADVNMLKPADLLTKITYPTGAVSDITYKPSTQYTDATGKLLNPNSPTIVQTVSKITTTDSVSNTVQNSSYSYEGGSFYYDAQNITDRRNAGFAKVTQTDSFGNQTETYYHQGNATDSANGEYNDSFSKIGRAYLVISKDSSGKVFTKNFTRWGEFTLNATRNFVYKTSELVQSFDGGATHKDKATSYTYDTTNGNLLTQFDFGEVTGNNDGTYSDTGTDLVTTRFAYATIGLKGLVISSNTKNYSGVKVKESRYYYDNMALSSSSLGNLTKQEDWIDGTRYVTTSKTYVGYGLPGSTTDGAGNTTSFAYDSYYLLPVTVSNALGQFTRYVYDYAAGKPKMVKDPNGIISQVSFDGYGRVKDTKTMDPACTTVTSCATVTISSTIYNDVPNNFSVTRTDYLDASTATQSITYADGLGRVIQTRKQADNGQYAVTDTIYDNEGRVAKQSLPYFTTSSSRTSPTTVNALYTTYTYDTLSRPVTKSISVGMEQTTYTPWQVTVSDYLRKLHTYYYNAFGSLTKVDEVNAGVTQSTTYTYDALQNLTNLTDAQGNLKNQTFNGLSKLVTSKNIHAPSQTGFGVETYTYDNAGRVSVKLDQDGRQITFVYDQLNRVTQQSASTSANDKYTYTYDTCALGIAKLCASESFGDSGPDKKSYTYTTIGTPATEQYTNAGVTETTSYVYNRQGNVTKITNPDNSIVNYSIGTFGLPTNISTQEAGGASTPLISNITYNPVGQPQIIQYANGATTTNKYDTYELYRLKNKLTQAAGKTIQDISYNYDPTGNINTITDKTPGLSKTQTMLYDDLHRLLSVSAVIPAQAGIQASSYKEDFTYDKIGNILTKKLTDKTGVVTTGTYQYQNTNAAIPHAVTSYCSQTGTAAQICTIYTFDKRGNLKTAGTDTYTFNWDNRLASAIVSGKLSKFYYDISGQRTRLTDPTNITTRYPTKMYNKGSNGTITKHQFLLDQMISTIEGTGTTAKKYFQHDDNLGGGNIETDSTGKVTELTDYYAYGDVRTNTITAGATKDQRKYTGHELDASTGLTYANQRYINTKVSKFISRDIICRTLPKDVLLDPQQLNCYSYGRNNPFKYTDPTGDYSLKQLNKTLDKGLQYSPLNWLLQSTADKAADAYAAGNYKETAKQFGIAGAKTLATGVAAVGVGVAAGLGAVAAGVTGTA